jgi:hypothetical protein
VLDHLFYCVKPCLRRFVTLNAEVSLLGPTSTKMVPRHRRPYFTEILTFARLRPGSAFSKFTVS